LNRIVQSSFEQSDHESPQPEANQSRGDGWMELTVAVYPAEGEKARRGRPVRDWACRCRNSSQTKKLKLNMTKTAWR